MISIDDLTQQQLLAADALGVVWLLELAFTTGSHRFSSFNQPLLAAGHTWQGLGQLLSVGELKESLEPSTQTLAVQLSVANDAVLALALGNVEAYRGRPARLYLALLSTTHQLIGEPRLRGTYYMQPVRIARESPGATGGTVGGSIELPLAAAGMARARNAEGLRLTHEQHAAEHPGDRFLEFMAGLIKQPVPWLSKAFQEQ